MDDRTRRMIEAYIPNPRDPELDFGEYYCLDNANRVQKVQVVSIFPHKDFGTICGLRYAKSGNHFTGLFGNPPFDGMNSGSLYDNKQDCADRTHSMVEYWEELRRIQMEENA